MTQVVTTEPTVTAKRATSRHRTIGEGSTVAISVASVFFGAATYIGNGPNFMVKSIAEQNNVRMPSFIEFILKFSLPFLLPVLLITWLLFFRG